MQTSYAGQISMVIVVFSFPSTYRQFSFFVLIQIMHSKTQQRILGYTVTLWLENTPGKKKRRIQCIATKQYYKRETMKKSMKESIFLLFSKITKRVKPAVQTM